MRKPEVDCLQLICETLFADQQLEKLIMVPVDYVIAVLMQECCMRAVATGVG